mgnify:CR=1 FL=1
MIQKLLKVGSSAAVTIPKKSLKELGLKIGDEVRVAVDAKEKTVIIEPVGKISEKLIAWTNDFIKKYRPVLKALAKK